MTARVFSLPGREDTQRLAQVVAGAARPGDAILLTGPLGAGKSVFARSFLRTLCADPALDVPSPTFTLVQTYDSPNAPVAHFDLWRLDGPDALEELGWDDARTGIVLVEWPDRLGGLIPVDALSITLTYADDKGSDAEDSPRIASVSGWDDRHELTALAAFASGRSAR